jgi:hypothetical protein
LNPPAWERIGGAVSSRKLFTLLLALAVLVAPGVTGAAMAAPQHPGPAMMEAGHCQEPASKANHHEQTDGKSCCIAMCMALAVAPLAPSEAAPPQQQVAQFALPAVYRGRLAEIATPPPRNT